MSEFVYSLLDLIWTPFTFYNLPILVVPFGFGVFCAIFLLISRLGRF